jgi:hypothetical protein
MTGYGHNWLSSENRIAAPQILLQQGDNSFTVEAAVHGGTSEEERAP